VFSWGCSDLEGKKVIGSRALIFSGKILSSVHHADENSRNTRTGVPVAVLICAECSLLGKNSSVRMNSKRITSPGQVNKKRLTIGHEAGHIIRNRMDRKEEAAFNHVGGIALQNTDGLSFDG